MQPAYHSQLHHRTHLSSITLPTGAGRAAAVGRGRRREGSTPVDRSDDPSSTLVKHRGLILAGLCLAAFIISLDITIVNVALPTLVRQLGATTTGLQWVVDAYNLVFAALVLVAGSLSDRLGR